MSRVPLEYVCMVLFWKTNVERCRHEFCNLSSSARFRVVDLRSSFLPMVSLLCLANIFYLSPPPHTQPPSFSEFVTDELISHWILICWYFKLHKVRTRWAAGCHFNWGSFYELGDHGRTVNLLCSHDSIIMFLEVRWARELQASQSQKHPFILISFYMYFWR